MKDKERLREISEAARPFDSNDNIREELTRLAISLYRDNYLALAAALSRYLLGECTIEQAFGLKRGERGRPPDSETLDRDAKILEARFNGVSWRDIGAMPGVDVSDARRLCSWIKVIESEISGQSNVRGNAKFHARFIAALSRYLGELVREERN